MTLTSSFSIATTGLDVQAERIKIHANNIANSVTPNYVRKVPVLYEDNSMSFQDVVAGMHQGVLTSANAYVPGGVAMPGVMEDPTPGKKVYQPGHPEADKNGFVLQSNVNVISDIADATATARLYEANLAVVGIVKTMANRAMEIGRGN